MAQPHPRIGEGSHGEVEGDFVGAEGALEVSHSAIAVIFGFICSNGLKKRVEGNFLHSDSKPLAGELTEKSKGTLWVLKARLRSASTRWYHSVEPEQWHQRHP